MLGCDDIITESPHTKLLVNKVSEDAANIASRIRIIHDGFASICEAQNHLATAYDKLSTSLRSYSCEDSCVSQPGDEKKQTGLQFSVFLEEVAIIHRVMSENILQNVVNKMHSFITDVFEKIQTEVVNLDVHRKQCEQAFHGYMKLPKGCNLKVHQNSAAELTSARQTLARSTAIFYGHLNEALELDKLSSYICVLNFIDAHKSFVTTAHNMFDQDTFKSLVQISEEQMKTHSTQLDTIRGNTLTYLKLFEDESANQFCPEPWILDEYENQSILNNHLEPNLELLTKAGHLLMRTRVNLLWRWVDVYCIVQHGNLMYQNYDDIAFSLLIDLNQNGVYAVITESDDRRNVFQIVSPTEKKNVILQAQSEVERDEWISTLTNVIFCSNKRNPNKQFSEILPTVDTTINATSTITTSDSDSHIEYFDWFTNYLPKFYLQFEPIDELISQFKNEMKTLNNNNMIKSTKCDEIQSVNPMIPSCSQLIDIENLEEIFISFYKCYFYGVVELPVHCVPTNQLNDIYSYIFSCRSASNLSEPIKCNIFVTKQDLWFLSSNINENSNSTNASSATTAVDNRWNLLELIQSNHLEILIRIPFGHIRLWNLNQDNHKYGCVIVQGPLGYTGEFAETNNCLGFIFESEFTKPLSENLLAAHFEQLDCLESETERDHLMSTITQLTANVTLEKIVPTNTTTCTTITSATITDSSAIDNITNNITAIGDHSNNGVTDPSNATKNKLPSDHNHIS